MLSHEDPHTSMTGETDVGVCRRYPPRWHFATDDSGPESRFPEVHKSHVCGEYRPRDAEQPI